MTFFDPPIQQDAKDLTLPPWEIGVDWEIRPLKNKVLGRRLEVPYQGKMVVPESAKKPTDNFKVEILAIGPKVYDAKVGEIAIIGIYRDLEIGDRVLFQEDDIRVIL